MPLLCLASQVSTIAKKSADGGTISTRVIQGPVRAKKRLMRVVRDTVNGLELLAEVEAPADCNDINAFLETLPSLARQRRHFPRQDSDEHYDNVTSHDSDVLGRQPNGGTAIRKVRFSLDALVLKLFVFQMSHHLLPREIYPNDRIY